MQMLGKTGDNTADKQVGFVYIIINSWVNHNKVAYKAHTRVLKWYFEALKQQPVVVEETFTYFTSQK